MTLGACRQALDAVGDGVGASLRAVDCAAGASAQAAFGRLFGADGALLPALTIVLTLYVAFFALALITGRARLSVAALTPRMLTLGLVLTFATSWMAYQQVVWTLAVGAPDQLAGLLTGESGSSTQVFGDKLDVVFAALVEAGGNDVAPTSTFSPVGLMWLGGTLLLLGTVGLLVTCKIALAILLALGPVFVVLALFPGTRGLFVGWLKGLVLLALAPLLAVVGGSLMLELAVPILRKLGEVPGSIDPRAAMAFFLIGAVHCALMGLVLKILGTMVAGWRVFGLAGRAAPASEGRAGAVGAAGAAAAVAGPARAAAAAPAREIRLARAAPAAANDAGPAPGGGRRAGVAGGLSAGPAAWPAAGGSAAGSGAPSRARGIGSRFRAAPRRTGSVGSLETYS